MEAIPDCSNGARVLVRIPSTNGYDYGGKRGRTALLTQERIFGEKNKHFLPEDKKALDRALRSGRGAGSVDGGSEGAAAPSERVTVQDQSGKRSRCRGPSWSRKNWIH